MKIFVVNLKNDVERRESIEALCQKYDLNYELIEAVNGFALNDAEIKQITSKKASIKVLRRELSKGEVGCTLSHLSIYKKIIEQNLPFALILEDDVFFDARIKTFIESFTGVKGINWDVVLLGYYRGSNHEDFNLLCGQKYYYDTESYLVQLAEWVCGTHGYVISNIGAQKLIKKNEIIIKPIDHYTGDSNEVNVFIFHPRIVTINKNFDLNTPLEQDRKRIRMFYKAKYDEKRIQMVLETIKKKDDINNIVIYGFGSLGKIIYEAIKQSNNIVAIIDARQAGTYVEDHKIIAYDELHCERNTLFINTILTEAESQNVNEKIRKDFKNVDIIEILAWKL